MKEDLHVSHQRADASLWDMSSLSLEFSKQKQDTCNIRERRFETDDSSNNSNLHLLIPWT
jgi:hypothetical protein